LRGWSSTLPESWLPNGISPESQIAIPRAFTELQNAILRPYIAPLHGNATDVRGTEYVARLLLMPTRHNFCRALLFMRAAIPISDDRISSVFDAARRLLLVDIEDGREVGRTEELLVESELAPRASRVAELHTDVLICGAITRPLEAMLISAGVEVIPQTCGQVEDVLKAFLSGQLTGDAFAMPGCCGRRRQFRGGQDGPQGKRPSG